MAAVNRAYTTEYTYVAPSNYAEEFVRQIPQKKQYVQEEAREIKVLPETRKKELISQAGLLRAVISLVIIGALLIGTVWMSATATEIKYSINKINKENVMLEDEIEIRVTLGDGAYGATAWGCDLTYDYVKINGDYRT